ncbi:8aa72ca3-fe27-4355-aefb-5b314c9fd8e0 [Thermothielavioides terrestris]|uniref:8aa72ca3-fe27-4355-aefb-5b314c9fd8e0 n=1 Tax=Thermothielavioides terrestris TaxID=2587410 RepID=A0A446BT52_9PEZI|nr:8aa72ca3-fe27-4355-aefb-5b314c9fd8e0 [Thermothielavioides terrestris]
MATMAKPAQKAQSQPAPPVKRPRGRPRKPRNNTVDTAIVLSDSESEGDDAAEPQTPSEARKRALAKVESPAPAPNPKRGTPSSAVLGTPQRAASAAMWDEVAELKQQLFVERKQRMDAEAARTRMQQAMEEKEASWAADVAAQMVPLQFQIQQLTQEKRSLETACKDLEARLKAAPDEEQPAPAPASTDDPKPAAPEMAELQAQIRANKGLIASQAAYIEELSEIEEARTQDLAKANQKITFLTRTLDELGTRNEAATKAVKEHESQIQQLRHDLAAANQARLAAEQTLTATQETLAKTEDQLATTKQQLAAADEATSTQAQRIIANLQYERSSALDEMQQRIEEVKGLCVENTRLRQTVTALEKEKQQLTAASTERLDLQKQLDGYKESVAILQREKQQLEAKLTLSADKLAVFKREAERRKAAAPEPQDTEHRPSAETSQQTAAQVRALQSEVDALRQEARLHQETIANLQRENQHIKTAQRSAGGATPSEKQLRDGVAQLTRELAAKDTDVQTLRDCLAKEIVGKDKLEQAMAAQATQLQQLDTQLKHKTQQAENSQKVADKLREYLKRSTRTVSQLRTDLESSKTLIREHDAILADKERVIAVKEIEIQQRQTAAMALTGDKARLQQELVACKAQLHDLSTAISKLTAENETLQAASASKDKTVHSLREQLTTLAREKDAATTHAASTQTNLAESASNPAQHQSLTELQAENALLTEMLSTLQTDLHALRTQAAATTAATPSPTTPSADDKPTAADDTGKINEPQPPQPDHGSDRPANNPTEPVPARDTNNTIPIAPENAPSPAEGLTARLAALERNNSALKQAAATHAADAARLRDRLAAVLALVERVEGQLGVSMSVGMGMSVGISIRIGMGRSSSISLSASSSITISLSISMGIRMGISIISMAIRISKGRRTTRGEDGKEGREREQPLESGHGAR